jgi:adenylate kinase family enzyme
MLKIHILGGPGSGKTTLAAALSSRFHVPHYELDQLGRKNGMRSAAYIEDAFAIVEQPGWVTEGIDLIWIDPLLYQADYIVLLEVSWPVAARRIVYRHIAKSLQGTNSYPGIKSLFLFLKNTHDYYLNKCSADTAESIDGYLEEHGERNEPPDTERLLARLEKYGAEIVLAPTAEFVQRYLEKYKQKVIVVKNNADRERLFDLFAQHW